MEEDLNRLEMDFDEILFQLSKGISIEQLKNGRRWYGFEQVKEWKNRNGYKLYIYSNDHPIAHFHLVKASEDVDCKFDFNGNLLSCAKTVVGRRIKEAVEYFCMQPQHYEKLVKLWNSKNPLHTVNKLSTK